MEAGHVILSGEGQLLSLDHGFCQIMQADRGALLGRFVLDVTAPADREECSQALSRLYASGRPFRISKRFLRDNGALVWVTNTVSLVEGSGSVPLVVATIDPLTESSGFRAPARLLEAARLLVTLGEDRASIFDTSLFSDTGWHAILATYIAEAEGRAIDAATLSAKLGISPARAARWITVLLGQGAIEIETRGNDPHAPKSFRLTGAAHARLEDHLSKANQLGSMLPEHSNAG